MGALKLAGGILVLFAAAMAGFSENAAMKRSIRLTEGFVHALTFLKEDMHFSMDYLDKTLKNCVPFAGSARTFFESVSEKISGGAGAGEVWEEELKKLPDLNADALSALCELGHVLGKTDAQSQKKQIEACIERLKHILEAQTNEQKTKGVLLQKCSVAGGLLIVILLL
mgnify:FL=1